MRLTVWVVESKYVKGNGALRYYDPLTNKKQSEPYSGREDLLRKKNKIQEMLLNQKPGQPNGDLIPLVVFEEYLTAKRNEGLRASTIQMKRYNLTKYLESVFYMKQVTNESIQAWALLLSKRYKVDTTSMRLRDLRAFLTWCTETGKIGANPFKGIKIPVSSFVGHKLTLNELHLIWTNLSAVYQTFFGLLLDTGARHGELLTSEWHEIDLTGRAWHIPALKCKTKIARTIPLSTWAVKALTALHPKYSGYVWPGWTRHRTNQAWQKAIQKAGITQRIRPHDLRHTFASNFQGPTAALKAVCGWKSNVMSDKYTHTELEYLRESVNRTSETLTVNSSKSWANLGQLPIKTT